MARYSINLGAETVNGIRELKVPRQELSQIVADHIAQRKYLAGGSIDSVPADNGNDKVQDDWIPYFNERGEVFAAAPDIVRAGCSDDEILLGSLRKNFDESCIVTSTIMGYNQGISARILHYFGSTTVRKPIEHSLIVPVLQGESLYDMRDDNQVSAYLEVLTGLKGKVLIKSLERLSAMQADKILLWTSTANERKHYSERAACFGFYGGGFRIGGSDWFANIGCGRAHRVLDVSAKPTAQKKAA